MEVQSNENAALLKLLKTKSRTETELLKVSSARRRACQAALDALLAEGKVFLSCSTVATADKSWERNHKSEGMKIPRVRIAGAF